MDWQPIIAGILVLLAAAWLLRRMWRTIRKGLGKGGPVTGCEHCPKSQHPTKQTPVVQLGERRKP